MACPNRSNGTPQCNPFDPCAMCVVDLYWERMLRVGRTLTANLAIGGALCAAREEGWDGRHDIECVDRLIIDEATYEARRWHPGCRRPHRDWRPAPGYVEKLEVGR
jgi:hypothetical protein